MNRARVLGAVLVGGASSRFGSDKAAAAWRGEPLAAHAAAVLAPFCAAVVRVGGDGVPDRPRTGLGPLGGVAGALAHAEALGFDTVLTIACDMPRVPSALIEALLQSAPACCADAPVLGHWPAGLAGSLLERLAVSAEALHAFPLDAGLGLASDVSGAHQTEALVVDQTPDRVRHDNGLSDSRSRHRRDGALSVRRWVESVGALSIVSSVPLANVNTLADLLAL